MSTNRPNGKLHGVRYSLRHNTGNGFVGIPSAANITESQIHETIRDMRRQGDKRFFVVTDAQGKVVAHAEP